MSNPSKQAGTGKSSYRKPVIREVELRPEEAVLGNCKVGTGGSSGPGQGTCSQNVACVSLGSWFHGFRGAPVTMSVSGGAAAVSLEGVSSFSFSVGGLAIRCEACGLSMSVDREKEQFASPYVEPDVELRVRGGVLEPRRPGRPVFESGAVWKAFDDGEVRVVRFTSPFFGAVPYKELRIDRGFRRGEVVFHSPYLPHGPVDPLEYPLDELVVVNRLGLGLGCELHACGVLDGAGDGWLLAGHSGAGKSTLGRLLHRAGFTVLSDDRIILRESGGQVLMHGTPWHGEAGFAAAGSGPLRGVLVLRHGPANRTAPLTRVEAVSELMARAFVPFHEPRALETALTTLEKAFDAARCARFEFVPDRSAVEYFRSWKGDVRG